MNTFSPDTLFAWWACEAMRLPTRDPIIHCLVEQWLQAAVTFPNKDNANAKEGTWH